MHGNVGEWCQDWYGIYKTAPMDDPPGPPEGSSRIVRGSSWFRDALCCRAACRNWLTPTCRYDDMGFRVVRQIPSTSP